MSFKDFVRKLEILQQLAFLIFVVIAVAALLYLFFDYI